MLRWQPRKWFEHLSLKVKIFLGSVLCHALVLFSLFVLYRGNEQYHILITGSMINTDVPIVFLPMHKSFKKYGGISTGSAPRDASSQRSEDAKPVSPVKKQTVALSLPELKSKKTSTKKNKKSKKEVSAKDDARKKSKTSKKIVENSSKGNNAPKQEPKIEVEKPQHIPEPLVESSNAIQAQSSLVSSHADIPAAENVLYVGQQEMDALQMQDYIQQEMAQHWSPPAGMRNDISCVVKLLVAFDGTIQKLEIDQSSGVMLFDDAAKRAAWKLTPPQWAYGKELTVTFKP